LTIYKCNGIPLSEKNLSSRPEDGKKNSNAHKYLGHFQINRQFD